MTTDTTEKGELMSASTGDLAELYAAHRLSLVRLAILLVVGQAGLGYLITRGVKRGGLALFVPTGEGELVEAVPTGDVPFGDADLPSSRFYTWTTNDHSTILTRVVVGDPDDWRFRVYRWDVRGPGEGGGPDNATAELVPTNLGEFCFDFNTEPDSATRC